MVRRADSRAVRASATFSFQMAITLSAAVFDEVLPDVLLPAVDESLAAVVDCLPAFADRGGGKATVS